MTPWDTKGAQASRRIKLQSFFYTLSLIVALGLLAGILWYKFKPAKYNFFEDPQLGVSIKYPMDWKKIDRPAAGAIVAFIAPKKDELELFNPNMNLTYVDLKKEMSFTQLRQVTMQQMGALFKDRIRVLKDEPMLLAGREGHVIVFVAVGIDTPLQYLNAWTMVGNRVYVVTYSNLAKNFDEEMPKVNAVIRSFRIKK